MDVNRAQGVAPLGTHGGGDTNQYLPNKDKNTEDQNAGAEDGRAEATLLSGLAGEITPAVQELLDALAAEIEPLRAALALSREREAQLREDLSKHAYLPIPGRREFLRELNHVLNHLRDLTVPPTLLLLHVANADRVRREHGRGGLERWLAGITNGMLQAMSPNDTLSNLGGCDFAAILLGADRAEANARGRAIAETLAAAPGAFGVAANVVFGAAEIRPGMSAESVIDGADRALVAAIRQ